MLDQSTTTSIHNQNKHHIGKLRAALYDCDPAALPDQLREFFAPDCPIHLAYPFEDIDGPGALFDEVYAPLLHAIPDLERREYICMAGAAEGGRGGNWVGTAGTYTGVFEQPWLDIPPTMHVVYMRYHEFFRIEDERIVEMQALWDIPQLMMQARAYPMSPSLGVEWLVPAPAHNDGVITAPYDAAAAAASLKIVNDMVEGLGRSVDGAEAMQLDRYWHPKMMWYGPAGIGSMRRLSGFRNWHQIPFLKAMPDRSAIMGNGALFADGDYVGFTAWPGMQMTITGDGWLGIPPTDKAITMRSLDFWRCENGMIRENWVLVDILSTYHLLGVDVFERMRELTYYPRHPRA